jgi:starch phosphorylase
VATIVRAAPRDTELMEQYGCGPIKFAGTDEALYQRHLLFDSVTGIKVADARDRFEAIARSVRDVLSQRWIQTEQTNERKNPKRVYCSPSAQVGQKGAIEEEREFGSS